MHRQTPLGSAFRGYTAGGTRTLITSINDGSLMQSMGGSMMKGEQTGKKVEAPQNYGFTSVVGDAQQDKDGKVTGSAEGFMSFPGGNRSFAYCGIMDDRRHRLMNLAEDAAKGAVGMFGQKEWGQQFLNTADGMFMTGNKEKKMRFALTENKNGKKQQQGAAQHGRELGDGTIEIVRGERVYRRAKSGVEFEVEILPRDESGGGSGGSGGGQQNGKPTGQKTLHKEDSTQFHEINGDMSQAMNKRHQTMLDDKKTGVEIHNNKNVYLGAMQDKGMFLNVLLADGSPAKNVLGLKSGGALLDADLPPTAVQILQREVAELRARIEALEAANMRHALATE